MQEPTIDQLHGDINFLFAVLTDIRSQVCQHSRRGTKPTEQELKHWLDTLSLKTFSVSRALIKQLLEEIK
jgi:hypothetical protein